MTRELSLGQWRILIEVFLSQHHEHCGYHFAPLLFVLFHLDDISFLFFLACFTFLSSLILRKVLFEKKNSAWKLLIPPVLWMSQLVSGWALQSPTVGYWQSWNWNSRAGAGGRVLDTPPPGLVFCSFGHTTLSLRISSSSFFFWDVLHDLSLRHPLFNLLIYLDLFFQ